MIIAAKRQCQFVTEEVGVRIDEPLDCRDHSFWRRTMLHCAIGMISIAVVCGCTDEPNRPNAQDSENNNVLMKKMNPNEVEPVELDGPDFTDAKLKALPGLEKIQVLSLRNTAVTDAGCRELLRARALVEISILSDHISDETLGVLSRLPSLRSLQIHRGPKIGDDGLRHLATCTALQELYLRDTRVTDKGMNSIRKLPKVWSLILDDTAVSDEGVASLAEMKSLTLISLNRTRVTGHGFAKFRNNERLSIYLDDTPATDDGVIAIAQNIPNLRTISLNRTNVSDLSAKALSKLRRLDDVRFSHSKVTDAGLIQFSGHPSLDTIYVRGCAVSIDAVKTLKDSRRELTVYGP